MQPVDQSGQTVLPEYLRRSPKDADSSNLFLPSHLGDLPREEEAIVMYDGQLVLHVLGGTFSGSGRVSLTLVPKASLQFVFESDDVPFDFFMADKSNFRMEMPSISRTVDVRITNSLLSTSGISRLEGDIKAGTADFPTLRVNGEPEGICRVRFHVLNFRAYDGSLLRILGSKGYIGGLWRGRVKAEFGPWALTLDALPYLKERHELLEKRGGCVVTHLAELRRSDRELFSPEEAKDAQEFLYWMLSFANGWRCGCSLTAGFRFRDEPFWELWNNFKVDEGAPHQSWFPEERPDEGLTIMRRAWELWCDKTKRGWMTRAIGLYVTGTTSHSGPEIELAKAQIALELLSWVVLREEQTVISEDGLDKLTAADRIRLMLSWCRIPLDIPPSLVRLKDAFKDVSNADGPLAVTDIRNSAIHPTKKNLAKLHGYGDHAFFEAWWLTLWYIEMVLLRLFDYHDWYDNRLGFTQWKGELTKVPWA